MSDSVQKGRLRFPAARRLKSRREFARVREEGRTFRDAFFLLGVLEFAGEETPLRAGFVTSRKVGGAVVRNRVRRRLREIVRRHQHEIRPGLWLVIVARANAAKATSVALEDAWLRLAERASILRF